MMYENILKDKNSNKLKYQLLWLRSIPQLPIQIHHFFHIQVPNRLLDLRQEPFQLSSPSGLHVKQIPKIILAYNFNRILHQLLYVGIIVIFPQTCPTLL